MGVSACQITTFKLWLSEAVWDCVLVTNRLDQLHWIAVSESG